MALRTWRYGASVNLAAFPHGSHRRSSLGSLALATGDPQLAGTAVQQLSSLQSIGDESSARTSAIPPPIKGDQFIEIFNVIAARVNL
jgi:hypothetical protein